MSAAQAEAEALAALHGACTEAIGMADRRVQVRREVIAEPMEDGDSHALAVIIAFLGERLRAEASEGRGAGAEDFGRRRDELVAELEPEIRREWGAR